MGDAVVSKNRDPRLGSSSRVTATMTGRLAVVMQEVVQDVTP